MKKMFLTSFFLGFSLFFTQFVLAFTTIDIQVTNLSQGEQNALTTGANPGDVLRFDIQVTPTDGSDPVLVVDLSNLLSQAQIIDKGLGELQGSEISFPVFDGSEISFFTRINESCSSSSLEVSADTAFVSVDLSCITTATKTKTVTTDVSNDNMTTQKIVTTTKTTTQTAETNILPQTGTSMWTTLFTLLGVIGFGVFFFILSHGVKRD